MRQKGCIYDIGVQCTRQCLQLLNRLLMSLVLRQTGDENRARPNRARNPNGGSDINDRPRQCRRLTISHPGILVYCHRNHSFLLYNALQCIDVAIIMPCNTCISMDQSLMYPRHHQFVLNASSRLAIVGESDVMIWGTSFLGKYAHESRKPSMIHSAWRTFRRQLPPLQQFAQLNRVRPQPLFRNSRFCSSTPTIT